MTTDETAGKRRLSPETGNPIPASDLYPEILSLVFLGSTCGLMSLNYGPALRECNLSLLALPNVEDAITASY